MGTISQLLKAQTPVRLLPDIAAGEWRSPGHKIGLALCDTRDDKIHG
jgi:hypothetical protein